MPGRVQKNSDWRCVLVFFRRTCHSLNVLNAVIMSSLVTLSSHRLPGPAVVPVGDSRHVEREQGNPGLELVQQVSFEQDLLHPYEAYDYDSCVFLYVHLEHLVRLKTLGQLVNLSMSPFEEIYTLRFV